MTFLRARPVNWTRGAGREPPPRPEPADLPKPVDVPRPVDVIVPIYGAPDELRRCLDSVAAHTDLGRHGVLLVPDGPQSEAVETVVMAFTAAHAGAVQLLRNPSRLGFVGSVNRGMRHSTRDVVLLNSDTVVTPRWLETLTDAAMSSGDAGTATPLSNNATLVSVPRPFEENLLPTGFDAASFAALVERVSAREYPRIPTPVGFCLYIRRALLDDIGLFDATHFGLGYGEENDFAMRALARGWLHVVADATFVEHTGHRSFGATRLAMQRNGARALRRLHPAYYPTLGRFMKADPLAAVRKRIEEALRAPIGRARPPRRIVHLVHGWPPFQQAGTELYAYWLAQWQTQWREVSAFARMDDPTRAQGEAVELVDRGMRVRLVTNNFVQRGPIRRNAIADPRFEREFARFLREQRPELLHIHHLAGHSFSLAGVARRLGIPIVYQIQDWWSLCGRVNLFDDQGQRCPGPSLAKCSRCAPMTRIAPATLWNPLLHRLRRRAARAALAAADAYVMGSAFIRDDYARAGLLSRGVPAFVLPYGIDVAPAAPLTRVAGRPLRFGVVGSILPHKGLQVAVEAFRGISPHEATLHAWGNADASPLFTALLRERGGASLTLEGRFAEEEKGRIFDSFDVLLVPSVGLESFGLAAREAMARGVPVVATADGALLEMFAPDRCGALFPTGDAEALRAIVRQLVDDPSIVSRWSAAIPPMKRVEAHAEEIEAVYERVLAGRS